MPLTSSSARHELLRARTATLHTRLETTLDVLGPGLSLGRYRDVLRAFFGYYAPLEARLRALAVEGVLDLPLRDRAALLERDLLALGVSPEELLGRSRDPQLPLLTTREHAAGCLYVLEGACLGGQVVAPALQRRLGLSPQRGLTFFAGEGQRTGARWRAYLLWLRGLDARDEEIADAAVATFSTLLDWCGRELVG